MCSGEGSVQKTSKTSICSRVVLATHGLATSRWSSFLAKHNISWQICFLRDSYVSALADASADTAHCSVHTDQTATCEVQIQGFQEAKLRRTQFQKPARLTFEGGRGSSGQNKQKQKPPTPKTRTKPENTQNLKPKCGVQLWFVSFPFEHKESNFL